MGYCMKCGQEIIEGAAFCIGCGTPVEAKAPAAAEPAVADSKWEAEEREFLENTRRLLVWERTAWSIASKVFLIMGIVFAALFSLVFLVGIAAAIDGDAFGGIALGMGLAYAIFFGGTFIALGIINKKACQKLPQYIDTVYTDFSLTYNRCGNVGMLVFSVILGAISPIFFIINFVRMKTNRALIEKIMSIQNVQG